MDITLIAAPVPRGRWRRLILALVADGRWHVLDDLGPSSRSDRVAAHRAVWTLHRAGLLDLGWTSVRRWDRFESRRTFARTGMGVDSLLSGTINSVDSHHAGTINDSLAVLP